MSRAFVKEDDQPQEAALPRPQRDHPNYVTPGGFSDWQRRATDLSARLQAGAAQAEGDIKLASEQEALRRDLRALEELIETAIVVAPPTEASDEVHFGAWVTFEDEAGKEHRVRLVGADEVCIPHGEVSWVSPLARALIGHRPGETALWERPGGNLVVEITGVRYQP